MYGKSIDGLLQCRLYLRRIAAVLAVLRLA
jgi:hypothetical protein